MVITQQMLAQSPHGKNFAIDCATCHHPENWSYQQNKATFSHDSTAFPLVGQHKDLDCRSCHQTLAFDQAQSNCVSCHADIHQQTVGNDCARCHTPQSWIVEDVTQMHENVAFPLMGVHANINCNDCHQSETNVRFSPTGVTCIDCHRADYVNTKKPDHVKNNFSNDCAMCHGLNGSAWSTEIIDHSFFPLEQGHKIDDCKACHLAEDYSIISAECISCHQNDFNGTQNPNHAMSGFSNNCIECHTISPSWKPVTFTDHDGRFFPIYSGKHKGVWTDCVECHANTNDFSSFTCVGCHKNPETDDVHDGISGYSYTDNACLGCHPTGDADMAFDHNSTNFPLTGAHSMTDCIACHALGYQGTSTVCVDCHTIDFNGTLNPNHTSLGISTDCKSCHTTDPGWSPATFVDHNSYYALNGAHALIANDCINCHNGDYNNTPNTCYGCHNADYSDAKSPDHSLNNFAQDCTTCHTENAWQPSTFNHDGLYFPIFSGKHNGQWSECIDCHTTVGDFTQFTCVSCHTNPETNDVHQGVGGYSYTDNACLACHPTGDADNVFDHNMTAFPLTGAHRMTDCVACHTSGYQGTSTICVDCHTIDFIGTLNPNHTSLGISTDCKSCHTTDPGWSPATFADHNSYYALNGAHALIANDCAACHNGSYNNTPNTCNGCHNSDYTATTNPNHVQLLFPTDCATCHSENVWTPSTFDHDGMYFPINSGKHLGVWNECVECHSSPGQWAEFTCITCHQNPETNEQHNGVGGYAYFSPACLACHPTGDADLIFDHNTTAFPLTGAHLSTDCLQCHAAGFAGTSTSCVSCHTADFNQSINPNHTQLNLTTDCTVCHTTAPGWSPATFPSHNEFYMLNGAHAGIASDCAACHNGDYNNTPTTCVGCHNADYTATTDPNHIALQFPTDCASCHSENAWSPSTFNHDNQYFPIYSGKHQGTWSQCQECHNNPSDYSQFTCITCHQNPETNDEHIGVSGYVYNSPACLACHPTGDADLIFDHNTTAFPLTGAHVGAECTSCHAAGYQGTSTLCVDCHTTDFNQSLNPNHTILGISTDCIQCHTTAPGWSPATFAVHNNYYVIAGAHVPIANDCAACHNGNYNNTPNTCIGCHTADFNATTNPDHEVGMFPTDCTTCHTQNAWTPSSFDHAIFWPLTGAHAGIAGDCASCHNGNYNNTSSDCVSCHQSDYDASLNPNHQTLGLSTNCETCHTTAPGWSPATFPDHNNFYVIAGAHITIANNCAECHNGDYNNTPNTCIGCHQSDFNATTNPDHEVQQFSNECASCHSQDAWMPSTFDHNSVYPLMGAHAAIANNCTECHINGNYSSTPNTCIGCHQSDFNATTNPDHEVGLFPTDCISCHTQDAWAPSTFDHNSVYPLVGAHAVIANNCAECHINGNYTTTPTTCVGCHQSDFNATTNPDHEVNGYPTDCTVCHSQNAWMPSTFDHSTVYPLTGAHASIANQCASCHINNNYNNTPNTCVGCHQSDYNTSLNPNHSALNLSTDCMTCHTTAPGWNPALMPNHSDFYVIAGAHVAVAANCVVCHNGDYNNTPNTCFGCHASDYNTSTNPNHSVNQFPTDCASCHNQNAWAPSSFNHNTFYPFTGAHASIASDCVLCHNGNYTNTPNTCAGCHTPDYNAATNPNHSSLGLSTDCVSCHTTAPNWTPALFPDHNNYYVLAGAHTGASCIDCHNGNYNNTPNTCVGCHQSDYNSTTNPNHATAQFPTDCTACHSQSAWTPSTFDHDNLYFPIYSGKHNNEWNLCSECHTNSSNYNIFSCINCHEHDDQADMADKHDGVGGYQYNSNACYACHPDGED